MRTWNKMEKNAPPYSAAVLLLLILFPLLSLTGCGLLGGDEDVAPAAENEAIDAALESAPQTGRVVCSAACAAAGQCGTRVDGSEAVLGNSVQPATQSHDRLFPAGADVFITNVQPRLIQQSTGEQLTVEFYQVQMTDGSVMGWVAGYCFSPAP